LLRLRDTDSLLFGTESRGLPEALLDTVPDCLRIPIWGQVRSLNLANAASIVLYEALRHIGVLEGK
jgi:tRNA (cytidine/uridine-2'-O-)-methyltransferase